MRDNTKNVNITTALFDIRRETEGDGRRIEEYLEWFDKTLSLKTNMTIYTEPAFLEFVKSRRDPETTRIICCELNEIPYYHLKDEIEKILSSKYYLDNIEDPSRIECKLSLYNIIQYSKFAWVTKSIELDKNSSDFYFWMDRSEERRVGKECRL